MAPFVYALLLHGVLGGIDVIVNHELLAKLPKRPHAGPEVRLHAMRELLFAAIFTSLAWFEWHGQLVWWIAALLLGEVLVSVRDTVIEGDTRVLPVPERALHVLLFINLGVVITLVGHRLSWWYFSPTELVPAHYGWASWVLSAFAAFSLAWALRDGLNVVQRKRAGEPV
jgi:hypothetical protein